MNRLRYTLLMLLTGIFLIGTGMHMVAAQSDEALPPHIIDVWPMPGVEMAGDEPLTITFDQPMDRPSVESAISFGPSIGGAWSWVDDRTA